MGGALLQIVAYGAQDLYLTGNPQFTYFKMVYRRHTNFAIETQQLEFDSDPNFDKKLSCTITRNGDLLSKCFLWVQLPELTSKFIDNNYTNNDTNIANQPYENGIQYKLGKKTNFETNRLNPDYVSQHKIISWVNSIGHVLIDYISIEIGGQEIDRQYGEWLEIWDELNNNKNKQPAYNNRMLGKYSRDDWYSKGIYNNAGALNLYIPLQFWFCRNMGLALPLVALQYHEVKFNIKFNSFNNCWYNAHMNKSTYSKYSPNKRYPTKNFNILNAHILCNYIYLDTDERKKFAQSSHEYLIDQVQFNDPVSMSCNIVDTTIDLGFNHPLKEIVWVCQKQSIQNNNDWFNYSAAEPLILTVDNELKLDNMIKCNDSDYNCSDTPNITKNYLFLKSINNYTYNSLQPTLSAIKKNILVNCQQKNNQYELSDITCPPLASCVLQLNGMDRFTRTYNKFFDTIQPYMFHESIPENGNIYVYSFGLKPFNNSPSGTCNFSRVDNATFNIKINDICFLGADIDTICEDKFNYVSIRIYALNFNVLRIQSGMGGVAYTN